MSCQRVGLVQRRWQHLRWLLWLAMGLFVSASLHAKEFTVATLETRLSAQVYVMDAHIEYQFSKRALEALGSGIPLTLRFDIEVQRRRSWLPDETVAALEQRYQLRYHPLSHYYVVHNINSGAVYTYPSREAAISSLNELHNFPLLDANLIKQGESYEVEMRVELETDTLPTPLRLISYVTPDWHLSSDWSSWSLKH